MPHYAPREVFLSHAHANANLVGPLQTLFHNIFSGLVRLWASSDPSGQGGVRPGSELYPQVIDRLREAEGLWVLATPESIKHPWIYYEAGIAKGVCPEGVTVLRVGVDQAQLPSPLSEFVSYDGLAATSDVSSIGALLRKLGSQVGMELEDRWIGLAIDDWVKAASGLEPQAAPEPEQPVRAEQVGQIDRILSRLEVVTAQVAGMQRRASVGALRTTVIVHSEDDLVRFLDSPESNWSEHGILTVNGNDVEVAITTPRIRLVIPRSVLAALPEELRSRLPRGVRRQMEQLEPREG